jgi:hypothetical protein
MSKTGVFKLTGPREGKTERILDKYQFVDGEMRVSDTDAALMEPILCRYYGATLTYVTDESPSKAAADGSLAKTATQPMSEAQKKAEAEAKAKHEADTVSKAKAETDAAAKAKAEFDARAKADTDAKTKAEIDANGKARV